MRRGWKILIGLAAGLAVLLVLNTIALDRETKSAEVTVDGATVLNFAGGDLQVLDTGAGAPVRGRPPIVLLHCFTCSINWWDDLIPLLRSGHRVIAIDLLGHGGSEKPRTGYSMENQAQIIAQALNQLGVEGATVVGHSLGATVATALAEQSSELVDRLVIVDQAPGRGYGSFDLLTSATFVPVLGEALWRTKVDFTIRDGLEQAFAPGFDVPDQFVDDVKRMTYTAYDHSGAEAGDYTDQEPLDERIRAAYVPLLVIFGADDQIYDARESLSAYADVPGARTEQIAGAGHSPNVERPEETAKLILDFAGPTARRPRAKATAKGA